MSTKKDEIKEKLGEIMADVAREISGDGGDEIKDLLTKAFESKGLKMDKKTIRAFREGLEFSFAMKLAIPEDRQPHVHVLAMSFLELFEREAKA